MNTQTTNVLLMIIAVLILCGGVIWFLQTQTQSGGSDREGTQQLSAEQVVDLEVKAEQEYMKTQQNQ